jgi:hypothetical protein
MSMPMMALPDWTMTLQMRNSGVLTYYDPVLGRERYKRRYVWAMSSFLVGLGVGFVLALLI